MEDSPTAHLSALTLDLYRACRELPVDRYQRWALERMQSVLPFDAGKWVSAHMTRQAPVVHSVMLFDRPPAMNADYERIRQHDVVAFELVARAGTAIAFNFLQARPDFAPEYVAYLAKWGTTHALACATVDPLSELSTGIGLWRQAPEHPFTEEERQFLGAAMPHLIETFAMNRIAHILRATQPKNASLYVNAIADGQGRLQAAPQGFVSMLQREWQDWRGHRLPEDLAAAVRDAAEPRFVGREVFFRGVRFKDLVLVQARGKQPADELTPRELQVARLAAGGLSYGEVASRLTISPATVRTHLSSVYGKLKARKQAEMVARLAAAE